MLDEPYEKVVDRIQSSGKTVTLLVCGKKAYDYFQAENSYRFLQLIHWRLTRILMKAGWKNQSKTHIRQNRTSE